MRRRPPTGPVAVPDMRPSTDQHKPGESMGEMLAAAIRTSEPGSDQFKALIATLDELARQRPDPPKLGRSGLLGLIAAIGLIAPVVQQLAGTLVGPRVEKLEAIESKLDAISEHARQSDAAMADLVRYVERIELEQAHDRQRTAVVMPARLRALVAIDEIGDESD